MYQVKHYLLMNYSLLRVVCCKHFRIHSIPNVADTQGLLIISNFMEKRG